jgi:hypothetical protein
MHVAEDERVVAIEVIEDDDDDAIEAGTVEAGTVEADADPEGALGTREANAEPDPDSDAEIRADDLEQDAPDVADADATPNTDDEGDD